MGLNRKFLGDPMDEAIKDRDEPEVPETSENEEAAAALPEPSAEERMAIELAQTNDRLLRLAAEYENFKKISARERQNSLKFANEALIASLLPIMDNLEQAVLAGKNADMGGARDLLVGVDMVLKQMADTLLRFGVEFFSAQGLAFDPSRHEAVCEQEAEEVDEGTVVQEFQRGCLLNGRLLRAARVAVAKKSSK